MQPNPSSEWRDQMTALQDKFETQFGKVPSAIIILYTTAIFVSSFGEGDPDVEALTDMIDNFFGQTMPTLLPDRKGEVVQAVEELFLFYIKTRWPDKEVRLIHLDGPNGGGFDFRVAGNDTLQ